MSVYSVILAQTLIYQDDFESGLKSDWRVLTSEGGYTPTTTSWWGKKLSLTENKHWQSNGLTLDYEFPTKNNKFVVEFNHYAYGGDNDDANGSYGGDGMAIILYDSLVGKNPKMGAFGGSLGYAQMRNDVTGDKHGGFQGGWLGIGLDEYGNYINHNEGKRDLDGTTIFKEDYSLIKENTVTIRGKQGTRRSKGYKKLASASVLPLAKTSSWGAFSGDKFRLTVDSRDDAHLYIRLQRDSGKGYVDVISQFDAMQSKYKQGTKPKYFRLAFAASTGGASNYHEIDNVKIWADKGWKYPMPHISIADVNITEGDSGKINAAFKVSLHEADPLHDTTIDFQTQEGSAQDESGNSDYVNKSGSITIPKGNKSATIRIKVDGDFQDESNETFNVLLSNQTNGIFEDANATGLIIDDDSYNNTKHYSCETQAFIYSSIQKVINGVWYYDNPTDANMIDLITKKDTLVKASFYPDNINAIGYSVADNFIWGYDVQNFKLTRTDTDNNVLTYDVAGLEHYAFHIGDVSPDGVLYMASAYLYSDYGVGGSDGIKRMYRVDVNPNSHTFLKKLPTISLSNGKYISADWAFNPIDKQLYMVNRFDFSLIRIDPETGKVDNLGALRPRNNQDRGSHVQFFDRDGYFYFYSDDDFYRVDLRDPAHQVIKAELFTHMPLSSNGDAARCAYAPMQNQITISDESILEGNISTQMTFTLTLDAPAPAGGMEISYHTQDGSAKAGSDYIKESPTPAKVNISAGGKEAKLTFDIVTDKIEEFDENFEVNLTNTTIGSIKDSIGVGMILNDDKNATASVVFNAIDDGSAFIWDKNISTKIVNKPFSLSLLAKNDDNDSALSDANITQLDLLDCSGHTIASPWVIFTPQKQTNSAGLVTINDLAITTAHPCSKIKIYGNYKNKSFSNISSDNFAIRPDHFVFDTPSQVAAGEDFNLTIEARDYHDVKIPSYTEHVNSSYRLMQQQQDSVHCQAGSMDMNNADFVLGKITKETSYTEVGVVDINISEILGSEFAKIDAKDDGTLVTIPALAHTITFIPAKFSLSWNLHNANGGYTLLSNDASEEGATLDVIVKAQKADGGIVQNYSGTCAAKDVNITFNFDILGNTAEAYVMHVDDANISTKDVVPADALTLPVLNKDVVYQTNHTHFNSGVSHAQMKINFERNANQVREPIKLNLKKVKVQDDTLSKSLSKVEEATFYYARAHAVNQEVVGHTLDAKVFYEVYCKSCDQNIFSLAKGAESQDSVFWYIIPSLSADLDFDGVHALYPVKTISKAARDKITISVAKTPQNNVITYQPKSYLYFNPFSYSSGTHKFKVSFASEENHWAGKGDIGKTVDMNISRKMKFKKIDW